MNAKSPSLVRNGFASMEEYYQYIDLKRQYREQLFSPEQHIAFVGVGVDDVRARRAGLLEIRVAKEDRGDDVVHMYRQHVQDCAQRLGLTSPFALSYNRGMVTISGEGLEARAFLQTYVEIVGREFK